MENVMRALAQRNQTTVLKALQNVTQQRVAELVGVSDTTVSAFKDREMERLCAVLAALELKVVPAAEPTMDPARIAALQVLARVGIDAVGPSSGWGSL